MTPTVVSVDGSVLPQSLLRQLAELGSTASLASLIRGLSWWRLSSSQLADQGSTQSNVLTTAAEEQRSSNLHSSRQLRTPAMFNFGRWEQRGSNRRSPRWLLAMPDRGYLGGAQQQTSFFGPAVGADSGLSAAAGEQRSHQPAFFAPTMGAGNV